LRPRWRGRAYPGHQAGGDQSGRAYLLPIVAIGLGATLHQEHTTLPALAGSASILCAVALIRRTPGIPGGKKPKTSSVTSVRLASSRC
jgi:hypothetical protein